jgi:hypothetical protein
MCEQGFEDVREQALSLGLIRTCTTGQTHHPLDQGGSGDRLLDRYGRCGARHTARMREAWSREQLGPQIQALVAEGLTRSLQAPAGYATVAMWRIRSMHLQL